MKSILLALLYVFSPALNPAKEKPSTIYTIPLPPRPDFSSLEWLIGQWHGSSMGRGSQGDIHLAVEYDLDKRFLMFREELALTAATSVAGTRESWMGILGANTSGSGFVLRMFSTTGFVTRYRVTLDGGEIHFGPEGGEQPPPGWLFRRTMERTGEAEFTETVQVAPPGRPFFEYYTAKFIRVPHP
jgi:hypothetical protein